MSHLLVLNPRAGRGRAVEVGSKIEGLYRGAGLPFELRCTRGAADATEFAREGARAFDAVVAIGGDGTFHQIVNGLAAASLEAPSPAAIAAAASIPIGTGNDFVKTLGQEADPEAGFAVLRAGRRRRIDLGRFEANGASRFFANQIQIGYGAHVVEDMASPRSLARRLFPGHSAYVAAGLSRILYRGNEVALLLDGVERRARFFEIHIANGRFCGGGISYAPAAELDDGFLDVTAIDALPVTRIVPIMLAVNGARLAPGPGVSQTRARRVEVRDTSPFPISADGEVYSSSGRFLAEIVPAALDLLAP